MAAKSKATDQRIPVTVLTGFLGAGKTTVLNQLLQQPHGQRLFVIQNEFGAVSIDTDLLMGIEESMVETINGCICCTVRSDLTSALSELSKRRSGILSKLTGRRLSFDRVVIETTGVADPIPVAQTFFLDEDVPENYRLDAVIAVVDARLAHQQLDREEAAQHQVAFADLILVNKTDLVTPDELASVTTRLRRMNATAELRPITRGEVAASVLLDLDAFRLDAKLQIQPDFLTAQDHHHHHHDHDHPAHGEDGHVCDEHCEHDHDHDHKHPAHGEDGHVCDEHCDHGHDHDHAHAHADGGDHTHEHEHDDHPRKGGHLQKPLAVLSHVHDKVSSVAIVEDRPVDLARLEAWLGSWLPDKSPDLLRFKGVLYSLTDRRRLVFQGMHMLYAMGADRPWGQNERPQNKLVFIGRDLDKKFLVEGFRSCLV